MKILLRILLVLVAVVIVGGALAWTFGRERAAVPIAQVMGPNPRITDPKHPLLPTLHLAKAVGWKDGEAPTPASGLAVNAFASGLDHPRWLLSLPNGDVLVAETNAPPKPKDATGFRAWIDKIIMGRVGASGKSANRITLLRDADGDGVAELKTTFLTGLHSPFGMALVGDTLYIGDTDALVKVPYVTGETHVAATPVKVVDLPGGPINHHWTKNVIASADGTRLYVTVGSNSNVGERGQAAEEGRAAIWEVDPATGTHRIWANGIRNPNGMGLEPATKMLWAVANERDELGSDIVPDYLTSVQFGGFYGWPWYYWGGYIDKRPGDPPEDLQQYVIRPDYALGPHTASLGLAFAAGAKLGPRYADGAFVGQHGSWNRNPFSGYKVLFVPFAKGRPAGPPRDVLTGFLNDREQARGRPAGVIVDGRGDLLVADDTGNKVWRVSARQQSAAR